MIMIYRGSHDPFTADAISTGSPPAYLDLSSEKPLTEATPEEEG